MKRVTLTMIALTVALVFSFSASLWADQKYGPGMGHGGADKYSGKMGGMTGGMGQGSGYGMGRGMGGGMMGGMGQGSGYGMGQGSGYGMGSGCGMGMMGGMGGGMMGGMGYGSGYGMGPGARHGMMGMGSGMFKRMAFLKEKLDLSEEQIGKIYSLYSEARKESIMKGAELKIAKMDLWDLIRSTKTDMAAVKEKLQELQQLRTDLLLTRIEKHEKVKGLLTPEQLEKFSNNFPWAMHGGDAEGGSKE